MLSDEPRGSGSSEIVIDDKKKRRKRRHSGDENENEDSDGDSFAHYKKRMTKVATLGINALHEEIFTHMKSPPCDVGAGLEKVFIFSSPGSSDTSLQLNESFELDSSYECEQSTSSRACILSLSRSSASSTTSSILEMPDSLKSSPETHRSIDLSPPSLS